MVTALDTAKSPTAAASLFLNESQPCGVNDNRILFWSTQTQQPSKFISSASCCLGTMVPDQITMY